MNWGKLFATIVIILMGCAGIFYGIQKDWINAIYWLALVLVNGSKTYF